MAIKLIAILITLFHLSAVVKSNSIPTPFTFRGYEPSSGKTFYGDFDNARTFDEARELCSTINGQLLTIKSIEEQKYISFQKKHVWLGVDNSNHEPLNWLDGTAINDNLGLWTSKPSADAPCAYLSPRSGQQLTDPNWTSIQCYHGAHTICEVYEWRQ